MKVPANYVKTQDGSYSHPSRVGKLPPAQPQPDPLSALDKIKEAQDRGRESVVCRITLVRCGQRLLDDDNLSACYKGLRDSIARTLKVDDADKRIEWRYEQMNVPKAYRGTIVKFELCGSTSPSA